MLKSFVSQKLEYKARENYVIGMLRLGAYYVFKKAGASESIKELLEEKTHLYRLTSIWDGKRVQSNNSSYMNDSTWSRLIRYICNLYEITDDVSIFEDSTFMILWPYAEPAIIRDVNNWPWIPEGYSTYVIPESQIFGCFAWEKSEKSDTVSFHIANACMPESPFKDIKQRAAELLYMSKNIIERFPETDIIMCKSWLNSFPPFLSLFPSGWVNNDQKIVTGSGCDWWGQFMKRDGSFHQKNADILRKTNQFPWNSLKGSCSMKELITHLESII